MKRNKKLLFLLIVMIAAVVLSVVYTIVVGHHYTLHTSTFVAENTVNDMTITYEKEGVVEVSDIHLADETFISDSREIVLEFEALGIGSTDVDITDINSGSDDRLHHSFHKELLVLPGNVIIDTTYNRIEFQAYPVLLIVLFIVMGVTLVVLLLLFIEYNQNGDFGYKMILCVGFGFFLSILFLILVYKWANNSLRFYSSFMMQFMDVGLEMFIILAPLLIIVSLMLAFSNIILLKKEGFRPVNALGIAFAVICIAGIILIMCLDVRVVFGSVERSIVHRTLLYIFCYFGAMFLATTLCAYNATRYRPGYDRDFIIILGCGIRRDGSLTPLLKARVDAALDFEREQFDKTGKHAIFVPSGGQGDDEIISESQAMTNYLISQGVDRERILMEDKSVNTLENMKFSKEIIMKHTDDFENCKIAFATTNYHVFRGYIYAQKNGFVAKGISAKTKRYFYPNAFLREFIGLLVDRKFVNLAFIIITLIVFVLFNYLPGIL